MDRVPIAGLDSAHPRGRCEPRPVIVLEPTDAQRIPRAVAGDVDGDGRHQPKKRGGSPSHTVTRPPHTGNDGTSASLKRCRKSRSHASDSEPRSAGTKCRRIDAPWSREIRQNARDLARNLGPSDTL